MAPVIIAIGAPLIVGAINFTTKKIYEALTGREKTFFWQNKNEDLSNIQPTLDFDELKRRIRLLVIDDEKTFPTELFISNGYFVEQWEKVKDFNKLLKGDYDIIILDIMGVAKEYSEDDGLGVLEAIKRENPSQIIVAYSGGSFDISKQRFWDLADEKIAKPSDFLKIKGTIDNLIKKKFTPERYISTLMSLLNASNVSKRDITKIEGDISNLLKGDKKKDATEIFKSIANNSGTLEKLISLTNTILKFFQ